MELLGLVDKLPKPGKKANIENEPKKPQNSILVIKEKVDKEIAEGTIKADINDGQEQAEQQLQTERFKELS